MRNAFLAILLIGLYLPLCTGCQNAATEHRVDGKVAQQLLDSVLASWKNGEQPDAWREKTPEVVVQDMDWMTGAKLVSYEVLDDKLIDANMHCRVKLTMQDSAQKQVVKTVTYMIGTSPVLTVFRSMGS